MTKTSGKISHSLWKKFKLATKRCYNFLVHRAKSFCLIFRSTNSAVPRHPPSLNIIAALAKASMASFHNSLSLSTLNTAVFIFSSLIIGTSESHPLRVVILLHLADTLFIRFHHAHHSSDLERAITCLRAARLHPVAQHTFYIRHHIFFRLFVMLITHADLLGDTVEFRDVLVHIESMERELKTPTLPLSDPTSFITDTVYDHALDSGNMDLLNIEIQHRRDTVAKSIVSTSFYCGSLLHLGSLLSFRFGEQNQRNDLDEAIFWAKLALDLVPKSNPERPAHLKLLARILSDRFHEDNQKEDLLEAARLMRECLDITPPTHPLRWEYLVELGQILLAQFEQDGNDSDLNEVIRLQGRARKIMPKDSAGQHILLNTLGIALAKRYEHGAGQQSDLDKATVIIREALNLTPPSHRGRLQSLCNLAIVLFLRFHHTNQPGYLDEAILFSREAEKLVIHPGNSPHLSLIESLSMLLSTRFGVGDPNHQHDIDEAVMLAEKALKMTPPTHSRRPWVYMRLSTRLRLRANRSSQGESDINNAIEYGRQAIRELESSETGQAHPYRHILLVNLSCTLCIEWEIKSNRKDLEESIMLAKRAVSLLPTDHPQHASCLHQLGMTLALAYSTFNEKTYIEDAINAFRGCLKSPSISPSFRFQIAEQWAFTSDTHNHSSAIEAYDTALQLLPQIVTYNLDIHSRQEVLTNSSVDGIARKAAKCALKHGLPEKAAEYLETGRAVFWGQVRRLRSPLSLLLGKNPGLARKLHTLSSELEHGSHRNKINDPFDVSRNLALDKESARLSRLNEELEETLSKIREITGLEDFMKPRSLKMLQTVAVDIPIVFLVPNDDESHCIIVMAESVSHISIPKFDTETLDSFVSWLRLAIAQSRVSRASSELDNLMAEAAELHDMKDRLKGKRVAPGPSSTVSSDSVFRSILTCLWVYVVEPVLKRLGIKVGHLYE